MYYVIYKITNIVNGKIYVGCHKTENLEDRYLGSGKHLKRAVKKYGKENFKKEILFVCEDAEEMYDVESMVVDESFINRTDTYNLIPGGDTGMLFINESGRNVYGKNGQKGFGGENLVSGDVVKQRLIKEGRWDKFVEKQKQIKREYYKYNCGSFKGKTHSQKTKNKISKQSKKHQKGKGNSQYGTIWITNGIENKKIKNTDTIPDGWKRGRIKPG